MSYGEILVGKFNSDAYGDVAFNASNTCGAEMTQWLSTGIRNYRSSVRTQIVASGVPYPDKVKDMVKDTNNNGVPDYMEHMQDATPAGDAARAKAQKQFDDSSVSKKPFFTAQKEGKGHYSLDIDPEVSAKIEDMSQKIADGLSCGFGGGSCMSFPINWAPLAPGNDPVVFGTPVGDGLKVNEGIPVFSALTTTYITGTPIPAVWPPFPNGAGGYFKSRGPFQSFFRVFVTPTLTMGVGTAICLGPTAVGKIPPK